MKDHFWTAFAASLVAAAVTTIGLFVIRRFESWARRNITYLTCFAAGVLISVSFLHIIPEALTMSPQGPIYLLGGYVFIHLFNRLITAQVHDRPSTADYALGLIPMLGIGLHSFIDGFIYSITFTVSLFTGVLTAIGMVLHEFPEGIITYIFLVHGGMDDKKALILAFLAAALTTPLGTLVSYPFIRQIDTPFLGNLLSLAGGALLYVGATHLLPREEREPRKHSLIAFGTGIVVAVGMILSKG